MPIFKYTVANIEGKKLSGTVEAPDETTARIELNNLGFSILILKETQESPIEEKGLIKYVFEAIDKNSKLISGTIPAETEEEAFKKLNSEYSLTTTALWKDGSSEKEIEQARKKGTEELQKLLALEQEEEKEKDLERQKKEQFTRTKIESILAKVNDLLKNFENEFDKGQKNEINKRINKLLRIKQSKNIEYILATAEELLKFIESQEEEFKEKGFQEKRLDLQIKTKDLLSELKKTSKPESISDDIIRKIEEWEKSHTTKEGIVKGGLMFRVLQKIKSIFQTPPQIKVIKEQIKAYNKQLWEFFKLYFKEPTPEYKTKVKNSIKTIYKARKKAVHSLKQAKKLLKERKKTIKAEEKLFISFIEELNSLSGWLIGFYLAYYFISLYITTKDFGLSEIPKSFYVYDSRIFKYILIILFLLHATTSIKVNFLKRSFIANIILPTVFIFGSIIVLLNF